MNNSKQKKEPRGRCYSKTSKRLIGETKIYNYYIQFDGTVFRAPKSKSIAEKEYHIINKPYMKNGIAYIKVANDEKPLMRLVLNSFTDKYKSKSITVQPKDGNQMNCDGANIRVIFNKIPHSPQKYQTRYAI